MFITLQQLQVRPLRFDTDIPAGEIEFGSQVTQSSPLHAEGTAQLLNHALGEIRVQGKVTVTMAGTCDRCLEPAVFPIENQFDLVYMPAEEANGGEDEIEESAIEVGFYEGGGLALNDVLREVVLLALPMQLFCQDDCKGICPICGQNRNQRPCDCHNEAVDDRWSTLKKLREEIAPH